MKLPTWTAAGERVKEGTATPLEQFIFNWEPAGQEGEAFRKELRRLLMDIEAQAREAGK